jgi:hypothetical protein
MPAETQVGMTKAAAEELRQARREIAATERREMSPSDVVRYLVRLWRQATDTKEHA